MSEETKKTVDDVEPFDVDDNNEDNPLVDDELTFEPIDCEDLESTYEDLKLKPLEKGEYCFSIVKHELKKSGPKSKSPGTPMVRFQGEVIRDDDVTLNGRKVFTQWYMLKGGGYVFFLEFCGKISPTRLLKKKVSIIDDAKGNSKFLDSFNGCIFAASVIKSLKDGAETGFNEMTEIHSV